MPGSVPVPVPIAPAAQNELQLHAQRQRHWQTMWQLPAASVLANPRNPAPPAEPVPPAKGQIIVLTGDGIGKSNTAFGMGMAMLAQNRPLAVVQFLPTPADSPVRRFLGFNRLCSFTTFGQEHGGTSLFDRAGVFKSKAWLSFTIPEGTIIPESLIIVFTGHNKKFNANHYQIEPKAKTMRMDAYKDALDNLARNAIVRAGELAKMANATI